MYYGLVAGAWCLFPCVVLAVMPIALVFLWLVAAHTWCASQSSGLLVHLCGWGLLLAGHSDR